MPSLALVTGVTGPGLAVTATTFNNVVRFELDTVNEMLTLWMSDKITPASISIAAATTLLLTVVAPNNYTLTIT
jgi:hypothetical protein